VCVDKRGKQLPVQSKVSPESALTVYVLVSLTGSSGFCVDGVDKNCGV